MSGWMTSEQRYGWLVALELKLRRASGVAFQDFFADVMARSHGDDFVPTRPRGSLGDRGCDGFLASTGAVYACYGKLDDSAPGVPVILAKMAEDYAKACSHLVGVMRSWWFVHNMLDGTPTDATVVRLAEMRAANPHHQFGVMGQAAFEERVLALPEADIVFLIGMAASAEDTRNMRLDVVAELVGAIMDAVERAPDDLDVEPGKVPADKMEFNAIPKHWRHVIRGQMVNADLVGAYLGGHHDAERGPRLAAVFKARYRALKEQGLPPGTIMSKLYESIVGVGAVTVDRAVAAQAILAFFFDACDIFEDRPRGAAA